MPYVLALDQGTTSSRALIFDARGGVVGSAQQEFAQHFPRPGWVEHDPEDLWQTQLATAREAIEASGVAPGEIAALGITNQRETTVVWDRASGEPIHRAIVWQDRRTADACAALREAGHADVVRQRTGLVLDPYFSGTKLAWILDHVPGARDRAARGDLAFGTVDTWLLWKLTGGRVHATDVTNASRTLLFDIHALDWSAPQLDLLGVPPEALPEVRPSSGAFGVTDAEWLGAEIPITGMAGDQHAALFGQRCVRLGMAKNTYGTGCFLLYHTGAEPVESTHGL
ncbi:MAG: FGGY family carbohydrate kinase, partial [Bacteroidota bacterium]